MTQIVKLNPEEYGLQAKEAATIEKAFKPMIEKMVELEKEFNQVLGLAENGIDKDAVKAAKELRLKYVKTRTGTAEIHKTAKAYYLAGGRFVDGWKNAQLFASQGKEQELEKIEKHFENIEAARIQKIREERFEKLAAVGYMDNVPGVELMDEAVFENFLKGAEQQIKLREEAERQEAEARMKAEQEERVKNERKQVLFKYGNIVSPTFDFELLKTMSEEEFQKLIADLEGMKTRYEQEQKQREQEAEKARLEAEQNAIEARKAGEKLALRAKKLAPYITFIRDYDALLLLDDETFDLKIQELQDTAMAQIKFENEQREKNEKIAAELEAKNKAEQEADEKKREAEKVAAGMGEEERFKALLSDLYHAASRQDGKFTTEKGKVLFGKVVKLLAKIETFVNEEIKK